MFKKLLYHSLLWCLLPLALHSCNKDSIPPYQEEPVKPTELNVEWENPDTTNFVSLEQVKKFVNQHLLQTKGSENAEVKIEPYGRIANTPLLYVVNYGKSDGWQILSSDARTPAVIAKGDKGAFSLEEGNPAVRIWMDMTADNIASVRKSKDEELIFTKDDIDVHKMVWGKYTRDKEIRKILDPDVPQPENGYWKSELYHVEHNAIGEQIEHLTPHWDQWKPYNTLCPLRTDKNNSRVPAGCAAIAVAGVLYYLHDIWDMIGVIPSSGYCNDYAYNNPQQYFSNYNVYGWSQMSYDYKEPWESAYYESLLIGYVGKKLQMNYGNEGSGADENNIRAFVFPTFGIDSSYGYYNEQIVQNNLLKHLPIIICATHDSESRHCFVIDGFTKTQDEYTYYNYWVPAEPGDHKIYKASFIGESHEPYYSVNTTSVRISAIKINWGWWTQWDKNNPINDGWYNLTSSWTVTNGTTYTYDQNVKMIYNLSRPN